MTAQDLEGGDDAAPDGPTRATGEGADVEIASVHGAVGGRSVEGRAAAGWRNLAGDAAVLTGLAGVAITQPVLDLFGNNPTFFVAGNYGRRQIAMFALVVAFAPAAIVFTFTAPARLVGRRAGVIAHAVGVGLFAALFGLVLCQTLGIDAVVPAFVLALASGIGVALAEMRNDAIRRFLAYLAIGNLAFVALFAFTSPANALFVGGFYADEGSVSGPPLKGPVTIPSSA